MSFLGPFVGVTFEHIGTEIKKVKDSGGAITGERMANKKMMGTAQEIGITETIDKESGNRTYVLPYPLTKPLSEDVKNLMQTGVEIKEMGGNVIIVSKTPLSFMKTSGFDSDGNIEETLMVTNQNKKESLVLKTPTEQERADVREVRNITFPKALADSIYAMSRHRGGKDAAMNIKLESLFKTFETMLQQTGNMNYDGAYTTLIAMSKKSRIAKQLLTFINKD